MRKETCHLLMTRLVKDKDLALDIALLTWVSLCSEML